MRMVRKTRNVVIGVVTAKGIEHQKGVEPALQVLRQDTGEFDTRPIRRGLAFDQPFNRARPGNSVKALCLSWG